MIQFGEQSLQIGVNQTATNSSMLFRDYFADSMVDDHKISSTDFRLG